MRAILSLLFISCCLRNASGFLAVKEIPEKWILRDQAHSTAPIVLKWFIVNQDGIEQLHNIIKDVSNPKSKKYGKYLNKEELFAVVSPPSNIIKEITSWIVDQGPEVSLDVQGDVLTLQGPAIAAEKLFNTKFCIYQHEISKDMGITRLCPDHPAIIPNTLNSYLQYMSGLSNFPQLNSIKRQYIEAQNSSSTYNIPLTIRELYGVPPSTTVQHPNATQSVLGDFSVGVGLLDDLATFDKYAGIPPQTVAVQGPPLAPYSENIYLSIENAMDIQCITGIAQNAKTYFWTASNGSIVDYLIQLAHADFPPLVNSISMGNSELDNDTLPVVQVVEQALMKLATRGVSVVAASGDTGALGLNYDCSGNPTSSGYFLPSYPATSPHVTAVGSTAILLTSISKSQQASSPPICSQYPCTPSNVSEVPAVTSNSNFTTGGGFSAVFSQPLYQAQAVGSYLALPLDFPPTAIWNSTNRAFPDVAVVGQNILMINGSQILVSGGTSASAPLFAGMLTLLNDFLLQNEKPPIGFANPLLYTMSEECPQCFNKFGETLGQYSDSCSSGLFDCCSPSGFYSASVTAGQWDPLTGLGSLNYPNVIEYLKKLHNIS